MSHVETKTFRDPPEVDRRLEKLGLSRVPLLRVVDVAISASRDATPFHPANAAGTLAYQYGTFALRNELVGGDWELDRSNGVEGVWNKALGVRVVYANVDLACDDEYGPKPRSRKGSGAERVCSGNLFADAPLPHYAPRPEAGCSTFFLMVDDNGAAELTQPIVKASTFSAYVERIYLSKGGDLPDVDKLLPSESEGAAVFEPKVVRK